MVVVGVWLRQTLHSAAARRHYCNPPSTKNGELRSARCPDVASGRRAWRMVGKD